MFIVHRIEMNASNLFSYRVIDQTGRVVKEIKSGMESAKRELSKIEKNRFIKSFKAVKSWVHGVENSEFK